MGTDVEGQPFVKKARNKRTGLGFTSQVEGRRAASLDGRSLAHRPDHPPKLEVKQRENVDRSGAQDCALFAGSVSHRFINPVNDVQMQCTEHKKSISRSVRPNVVAQTL